MGISTRLRWVMVLACLLTAADSIAQTNFSRHNWYFGNTNRAIRFSRSDNTPSLLNNKAIPFGTGGSAVASNPVNGDLMFYTDGQRVFDVRHQQMPSGTGLLASANANQPVAVSARPTFVNQYYIFTNTASFTTNGNIYAHIVDMTASGNEVAPEPPIGNVTTRNIDIGLGQRSEAMIVVPHNDGINFWLITHENGTDNFTSTLVDGTTFNSTTYADLTGVHISAANFSYHEATGKIAVSPQTNNNNVAILNFDNATGAITFDRFVLTSGVPSTTNEAIYDTEWSPSGRYLYISTHGQAGINADVVQFDITADPNNSLISILSQPISRSYGLMLAPDTAIYHLYQATAGGPFLLGKLTQPDSAAAAVMYTPDAFGGAINFAGRQFPEFLPRENNNLILSFTTAGSCSAYPTSFFPHVLPAADSLNWTFGDGASSSDWSPVHTYQNGQVYSVTLTAFLNGQSHTVTQPVTITNFTLQLTLPQDTTACRCEFPPPVGTACNNGPFSVRVQSQGGTGSITYTWSNGDIGETLTPDSAGYYYVLATDSNVPGCVAYAAVNVREYDATDQRANIWYFGRNAGIDFNEQPPVPIPFITDPIDGRPRPPIVSPEGVSVISDRNGQVIFSTDGVHVFDRNDRPIVDAGGVPVEIGGQNTSSQSALIIPVPGDETLYYIFTTQEIHGTNTYELRYSLYDIKEKDMNLDNGDGGLVVYNQLLFTRSTERITSNGRWLVAHEFGNNSFRAYEITPDGIGNPVISSIGSDHRLNETGSQGLMGQGYMKFAGAFLAVALPDPPNNFLELFDFVDSTGVVTNFRRLDLQADQGRVYGIEIAGRKIIATISGTSQSFLREAYIDFQNNPVLVPGSENSPAINLELGAIQRGPDGQIYVAVNNQNFLSTLNVAGDTLTLSTLNQQGFFLDPGARSFLGLPNFIQEIFDGNPDPSMSITGLCAGSPSQFQVTGTDQIDEFLWTYDGGLTSTQASFSYTFPTPGSKTVTVRITNRCGLDTLLTQTIVIQAPPPNPTFVPAGLQPTVCNGPLTLEALPANIPGLTYLWSTGETTYTIEVDRPRNIGLTITNAAGCTSNGNITIADNRPVLDLGPDREICQDEGVAPLDAQNPGGLTYEWRINGTNSGNTRTQAVTTTTPGTFKYWVEVVDPLPAGTGCRVRDSVVFTVNARPQFTATASPIVCGATNGQIELDITAPAGATFGYSVTGLSTGATQTGTTPVANVTVPNLSVDTYLVDVTDQVTGCETSASVGVNASSITLVTTTPVTACGTVALNFDVDATGGAPWSYRIINATTGALIDGPIAIAAMPASITTSTLVPVPGDYIIEVLDNNGCRASENIHVVSDALIDASIGYDVCPEITLTATHPAPVPGISYSWFGPNINPATDAPTITVDTQPDPGVYTYGVILNAPGFCETTHTVQITVDAPPVVDFALPDPCVDNATLQVTVTPQTGGYTYLWTRDGVSVLPSGNPFFVTTADNGSEFQVTAISSVSGCRFTSQPKIVNIFGTLTVSMQPVSPCRGTVFSIEATVIPGATYQWYHNGALIAGQTSSTVTGLTAEGRYRVVASRNGCTDEEVQEIRFVDDPDGGLPSRRFICNRPENRDCSKPEPENSSCIFQLEAAFGVSWQWYRANEVGGTRSPIVGQTSRVYLVTAPGVYSVDIVGPSGCTTTDQIEVIERCQPEINLPNAFRPEGDQEINRTFSVLPFQSFVRPEGFQVFIFNRWGEMVYQSNKLDFQWNGTYKGTGSQLLPGGTYTYVIKYYGSLTDSGQQELRGAVMLLR